MMYQVLKITCRYQSNKSEKEGEIGTDSLFVKENDIINISERLTVFLTEMVLISGSMLILIWLQFIQINYVGKKKR